MFFKFCLIGLYSLAQINFNVLKKKVCVSRLLLMLFSLPSLLAVLLFKTQVQALRWEDLLEKGMATHTSILTWRMLWTEEHGKL